VLPDTQDIYENTQLSFHQNKEQAMSNALAEISNCHAALFFAVAQCMLPEFFSYGITSTHHNLCRLLSAFTFHNHITSQLRLKKASFLTSKVK